MKNTRRSRATAMLMSLMMVLSMLPQMSMTAHADTGEVKPTIVLGTEILRENVNTTDSKYILMKGNPQFSAWMVIGYDGHGVASEKGTMTLWKDPTERRFIMSGFRNVISDNSNYYSTSDLKKTVDWIANNMLADDSLFREAIRPRTLEAGGYNHAQPENTDGVAGERVENALLWPLSTKEASDLNQEIRKGINDTWWLRSPGERFDKAAAVVSEGETYGNVLAIGMDTNLTACVIPAVHINLDSVLFTSQSSASGGGKSDSAGIYLTEVTPREVGSTNVWKLTIKDSTHKSFNVNNNDITYNPYTGVVTVPYTGAKTGENEYISAIIKSETGEVKYYGKLKALPTDTVPAGWARAKIGGIMDDGDKFYVFNETSSESIPVDYSSDLQEVFTADINYTTSPVEKTYGDVDFTNELTNTGKGVPTYSSSDTKVARVDGSTGRVTIVGAGEAEITATVKDTREYTYKHKTASYTLHVSPRPVSVSGIKALDKIYDGKLKAALNYDDLVVEDVVPGDDLTVTATGLFDSKNAANNKTVTIGDLRLIGTAASNYKISESGNQTTASAAITPLPVVLKWSNTFLTFNGNKQKPTATVANLQNGDVCTVDVEGEQIPVGMHTARAVALTGEDNGNYILPSGIEQTFFIVKADANLDVSIEDWTYGELGFDPNVTAPDDYIVEYKELKAKDRTYTTVKPTKAGDYTVRVTLKDTTNYYVTTATDNFTIRQKPVNLFWPQEDLNGEIRFTYTGSSQCPTVDVGNLEDGDKVLAKVSGAASTVGTHTAEVTSLTGEDAANYKLQDNTTHVYKIIGEDPAPGLSMKGWTYQGASEQPVNQPELSNVPDGATVTCTYANAKDGEYGSYADKVGGNAGTWYVKATIKSAGKEDREVIAEFTIDKKTADLEWANTRFTYDGNVHAPTARVGNLFEGDQCDVTVGGGQTNAGEYNAKATKLSNDNYKLPDMVSQVFIIAKAKVNLKVKIDNWYYDTYEGDPDPEIEVSGNPEGTTPKIEYSSNTNDESNWSDFVPWDAGTYTIRASLPESDNYQAAVATSSFEIAPVVVDLKWSNTSFIYDGKEKCPEVSLTNLVKDDTCEVTVIGSASSVGTHTAMAIKLSNSNYKLPEKDTCTYEIKDGNKEDNSAILTMSGWTYGDEAEEPVVHNNKGGAVSYLYKAADARDSEYKEDKPSVAGSYTVKAVIDRLSES